MSLDSVRAYFKQIGIEHRILEFSVSSATAMPSAGFARLA